jgi:hypothetical protein
VQLQPRGLNRIWRNSAAWTWLHKLRRKYQRVIKRARTKERARTKDR